jgi:hypothetical protein
MECPGQVAIGTLAARTLAAVAHRSTDNSRIPSRHFSALPVACRCLLNALDRGTDRDALQFLDVLPRDGRQTE